MILPHLYHWSPAERHEQIEREGLRPYSPPTISGGEIEGVRYAFGYACLSPTPSAAWSLSGAMDWMAGEVETWDLWQVTLDAGDEVHVRPNFGPIVEEIKVYSPIPAERCWWVATREMPAARPCSD